MKKPLYKREWIKVLRHWRRMSEQGLEVKDRPIAVNCVFCHMFLWPESGQPCEGCPIRDVTGKRYCAGTPYTVVQQFCQPFEWNLPPDQEKEYRRRVTRMYRWLTKHSPVKLP